MYGSLIALQSVSGGFLTLKRKTVKLSSDGMQVVRSGDGAFGEDQYVAIAHLRSGSSSSSSSPGHCCARTAVAFSLVTLLC